MDMDVQIGVSLWLSSRLLVIAELYIFFFFLWRYATTLVTSEVYNPEQRAREIYLTVILPDTAFISRFAIEIGGQLFVAYVKEKEEAWKTYQDAVSQGKTAGDTFVRGDLIR